VDNLGYAVLVMLLTVIVFTPIYCAYKKLSFIKLNLMCIPIISIVCALCAYWPHIYTDIRLSLMGFDFNGMSDAERSINVTPDLRDEATRLYWSNMGVGWPLTAILWAIIFLPYPTAIWLLAMLYKKFIGVLGKKTPNKQFNRDK
jgi:hypothetical protein